MATVITRKPRSSYWWFVPIALGLLLAASSIFDSGSDEPRTVTIKGVTYENTIADTVKTCSDLGLPNTDPSCPTALDTMDTEGGINLGRLIGGILLIAIGFAGYTGRFSKRDDTPTIEMDRNARGSSSYLLTPLLFLQQIDASSSTCEGWWDCYRGVSIGLMLLVAGLIAYFLWRGRKKDTAARTARYGGL